MKEDEEEDAALTELDGSPTGEGHAPLWDSEAVKRSRLHGMYRAWFLDYASYVILERAVPHIDDGLKPVQRRILHTMSRLEDGRYNKVANIVGATMSFHPHGDASIGDALVQLGQKELLIDTQGNWGNILTGDDAAAPRYIEARLTKLALEVVFNPKTTVWKESYDGRNEEPVTLPVRFPLLLAQGVEGIAVGLASKILPHNFCELLEAAIAHLENRPFELYPDFPTGGSIDCSRYNDGLRGGSVRIRAKIEKRDAKTLAITEVPYSRTTGALIDSILKVNDKKIKIRRIDDNTSAEAEILIHLPAGASPDKTIDALYAFTDCELSVSPNACVIMDRKPHFLGVSDILRHTTDRTVELLRQEQTIRRDELQRAWHLLSLEKIFIGERIYKDPEFEQADTVETALAHVLARLNKWLKANNVALLLPIGEDDLRHLLDIKMARILRFNAEVADDKLRALERDLADTQHNIDHIVDFTIAHYRRLLKVYGPAHPRRTELRSFDNIQAVKVAERNRKLFFNAEDGFLGYGLRKGEYVCDCSDLDEAIVFYNDGRFVVRRVDEKSDVGMGVEHVALFKRGDQRTVYNIVYTDGASGLTLAKRFNVGGVTLGKEYNMTLGTPGTRVRYFSSNANGEAEVVRILLEPRRAQRTAVIEYDFAKLAVKSRGARGNTVTKNPVKKVDLRRRGGSTLGGRQLWFEPETLRLNVDGRGRCLGEFAPDDKLLQITRQGQVAVLAVALELHFPDDLLRLEKYDANCVWTALYRDAGGLWSIKRFRVEAGVRPFNLCPDEGCELKALSSSSRPRFVVQYQDSWRSPDTVEAAEYVAEKGSRAKGKRLSTLPIAGVVELEPEPEEDVSEGEAEEGDEASPDTTDDDSAPTPDDDETGGGEPPAGEPTLF